MSDDRYDVVIIGGGVVGSATARELSRYQLKILLLEKEADVGFGTSKANSGIVHSGEHNTPGTLKAELCTEGNRLFESMCAEVQAPFRRTASLVVAFDEEQLGELQKLLEKGRKNGVPGLELVGPEFIREHEPVVSETALGALRAPSAGITNPFQLTAALAENAQQNGVKIRLEAEVTGIESTDQSLKIKLASGEVISTRYAVNAAGLFSDTIAQMVGDSSVKLNPRRGEEYVLDTTWGNLVSHVIFPAPSGFWGKGILVIPAADGSMLIGPTADDIDNKIDSRTTREGFRHVLESVQRMVPCITESAIVTSYAGIRASSEKGDFIIGPCVEEPRLINAAGIESPGLTASPAIAKRLVRDLESQGLTLVPNPSFNPKRIKPKPFAEMTREERIQAVAKDPNYGILICRCREVSKAEVLAALRAGARTVDGIKLRTGCGAGRCQGGFCLPKLLSVMSEELGISPVEITKRGKDSQILVAETKDILKEGADA